MRRREHNKLFEFGDLLAGKRVDHDDPLNVVAKELNANRGFVICRMNLDGVATNAEFSANQVHVIAFVLHIDKATKNGALFMSFALTDHQHLVGIFRRIAEAVDTRHRRNHDRVSTSQQRRSCGVTQPLDLVVY